MISVAEHSLVIFRTARIDILYENVYLPSTDCL
jgi:hypothetical protein